MELPNDLIKATNYSKAKEREIHEFEYVNGKYIHKYVLGGEHEMTPQEIVDCLNAIATIDCDLSTAYAYIKGQDEKIADLQHQLEVAEKALELACKRYWEDCGMEDCPCGEDEYFDENYNKCNDCSNTGDMTVNYNGTCWVDYFKEQAEKEIKGE